MSLLNTIIILQEIFYLEVIPLALHTNFISMSIPDIDT